MAKAKAKASNPPTSETPTAGSEKSHEQLVREAAYRRFEERGGEHGHHEQDWLDAENEVRPPEGN